MKTKIFFSLMVLLVTIYLASCKETGTGPGTDSIDTTSQNYTFQTWEFGAHSSSVLYDVAIIDENNIWAVGEIYLTDSLGQPVSDAYNVVHWDGNEWKLQKILVRDFGNFRGYYPLKAVFGDDSNNVWFGSYADLIIWNGIQYQPKAFFMTVIPFDGQMNRIWGEKDDVFCAGNNGSIYHYRNQNWEKLTVPEGTNVLDVYDIKGFKTGDEYEIYAVAAKHLVNRNKKILRIESNSVTEMSVTGIPYGIRSIWGMPGKIYYVVGSGMYKKTDINSTEPWEGFHETTTPYYLYSIDGQAANDIVCSGSFGELLHFNGKVWKSFQNTTDINAGALLSVKIKDNIVVAVGYDNPKAVIVLGRRD